MKKILIVLCLIFFLQLINAEDNFQTVTELQIEKEYSEWLQEIITPYAGKNLVIVDLTLEYPQASTGSLQKELDETITLPGFPVAKTSEDQEPDKDSKTIKLTKSR